MVDCPHISGSVCIAAVNLSQLQLLREFNDVDYGGRSALRIQRRQSHDTRFVLRFSFICPGFFSMAYLMPIVTQF
ncbi:unnamed protein product [Heligmosomoides polygyrus]|uniref:Uncharacterized protein n=1 Tax=Heligmosomoides polygyrus TaxID=6339 RepID=A0A183FXF6_HELPZ|nr:unnamed protein product [Heligmosomoides polygyrus]